MSRTETVAPPLLVHALVTPSHEALARDAFLRTLPGDCRAELRRAEAAPVVYGDPGWPRVVARKFELLERAFAAHADGSLFVMSDVDVRFYRPFAGELRALADGFDLLFQNNRPGEPERLEHLCTGFVAVRAGAATRDFFRRARAVVERFDTPGVGDQRACIRALAEAPEALRWRLLPERYWVPYRHGPRWQPGDPLDPPLDLVLHHANWTVGNERKRLQIAAVERIVAARAGAPAGVTADGGGGGATRVRQAWSAPNNG